MTSLSHRRKYAYSNPSCPVPILLNQDKDPSKPVQSNASKSLIPIDVDKSPEDMLKIPSGPVFYPTQKDLEGSPLDYINKIRPVAQKYGICKIVPPPGWDPPFAVNMDSEQKFQTKEQLLHRIQDGISFGDGDDYCVADYLSMAHEKIKEWKDLHYPDQTTESRTKKTMTPENMEKDYWDIVEYRLDGYTVKYGNDVDTHIFGSGFPRSERGRCLGGNINQEKVDEPEPLFGTDDYYKETYWNLNNVPCCHDSILKHVKVGLTGINVPWLYFGSLFATFCYHTEDNDMYSFNYHHYGAPKCWYGIPGNKKDAEGMEKIFKSFMATKMRDVPDLLHHITTMFNPRLLQQGDVPVYKLIQHPGEFVLTFPRAFHGGFSFGPNVGEAVNFATHDWISFGAAANERYRNFARPAVLSHDRLTFTLANHLEEQKSYHGCILLVQELQRVVTEEMNLRRKLLESGVRDISSQIRLPKNRLDQIDEQSADYDDKRLCHACKHVCFFSCVACECSQSKVSCLRHSHFMCRCPAERKYLMIWSSENEMRNTLEAAEKCAERLKLEQESDENAELVLESDESSTSNSPGSLRDLINHEGYFVDVSDTSPILRLPITGQCHLNLFRLHKFSERVDSESSSNEPDSKRVKVDAH